MYIAEWDGVIPDTLYRVVGGHSQNNSDDCMYIFSCEDKTKLSGFSGADLYKVHHEMYNLQFLIKWYDLHLLSTLFSVVNKMFRWCDMSEGYNKIKT